MERGLQKANHYNQLAEWCSGWMPAEEADRRPASGAQNREYILLRFLVKYQVGGVIISNLRIG